MYGSLCLNCDHNRVTKIIKLKSFQQKNRNNPYLIEMENLGKSKLVQMTLKPRVVYKCTPTQVDQVVVSYLANNEIFCHISDCSHMSDLCKNRAE